MVGNLSFLPKSASLLLSGNSRVIYEASCGNTSGCVGQNYSGVWTLLSRPGVFRCVAAVPALKSVDATSNTSCELIKHNTTELNIHNAQPINIYENEAKS